MPSPSHDLAVAPPAHLPPLLTPEAARTPDPWEAANRAEYGDGCTRLRWPSTEQAAQAEATRRSILDALAGRAQVGCGGTKLDCAGMSPGCRLCTEGAWSCLFISGRCNARCFYCPSAQSEVGIPSTNGIPFDNPSDYADYVEQMGFRGVSISGGEPLLTFDRTLAYLSAVRRRLGGNVYLWMYTNGILLNRDACLALRDVGLDEIRLDIGATGYRLDAARLAAGVIPRVTVEIPAVPEDAQRLKQIMHEMPAAGVDHVNLHQLRLTPHNFPRLTARSYTFLHGPKVTVLESELTALGLLLYAKDAGIVLPVNYCSFVYKHRFQAAAARRRAAARVLKPLEEITAAGYIRRLRRLAAPGEDRESGATDWKPGGPADPSGPSLVVSYHEAALLPTVTYRNAFTEIRLAGGRRVVVERRRASRDLTFGGDEAARWEALSKGELPASAPRQDNADADLDTAAAFECIEGGLQRYG